MFRRIGFAGLLIPAALAAQATPCMSRRSGSVPAAYADVVARERTLVCERLATRIPGVQVAVAVNGKLVWSEGFGYADAERKKPVTRETQFRIGSVSRSEEHTSELQSLAYLVCRLLLEKKKKKIYKDR